MIKLNTSSYFRSLKGYRISKGHFELGSNLHINDYFYAKRLFYNSFYTNRFAFLITRYILETFSNDIAEAKTNSRVGGNSSITLLGYENYSDLLVSNIRKMLNDHLKSTGAPCDIFNHDICTRDTLFLKNPERLNEKVISIFPISTTFSTSLKIQTEIMEKLKSSASPELNGKSISFLDPVINCLVIAPEKLDENKDFTTHPVAKDYGWGKVDISKRSILIKHLDNKILKESGFLPDHPMVKTEINQRYFISLHTPWYRIDSCKSCYPEDLSKEVCLIETKASSITPNLIFGYPKCYPYRNELDLFNFFDGGGSFKTPMVYRKHIHKHGKDYIYYIRVGRFLQHNRREVAEWLRKKCKPMYGLLDKKIVIITSTLGSNSGFVNLVNDVLFSDVATIIQYSPKEEFLHNFKMFYTELLQKADTVIYVDDVLATTNTISEINFFIRHVREEGKGLDFSLALINRSNFYNYAELANKLKVDWDSQHMERIFNFIDINVPPIMHRREYPYVSLVDKYGELSFKSVLDTMRVYFKEKEKKFSPIDLNKDYDSLENAGTPKALHQFLIAHEFMKLFKIERSGKYIYPVQITSIFETDGGTGLGKLVEFVGRDSPGNSIKSFNRVYPEFSFETENALMKLCSSEPFVDHGKIRKRVFDWVFLALSQMARDIKRKQRVDEDFFQAKKSGKLARYSPYQNFCFLMKRASKLKMNYIYSLEILETVNYIVQGIELFGAIHYYREVPSSRKDLFDSLQELEVDRSETILPSQFITYYISLLQELIFDHESKALKLVFNIKKIIDSNIAIGKREGAVGKTLKNSHNDDFIHLLRLLVLENTFIFHSSCEKFFRKKLSFNFAENEEGNFFRALELYLDTYPFLYNRHMLSNFSEVDDQIVYTPAKDIIESFKAMMLLKAMLQSERNAEDIGNVRIEDKLQKILKLCCDVLGVEEGGAFFAVRYQNRAAIDHSDDIAIVSSYCTQQEGRLDPDTFSKDSFLHHVFTGISESENDTPTSTFEVSLDDAGEIKFRKNINFDVDDTYAFSEFQEHLYGRIFYLRITEILPSISNGRFLVSPQAVLGFYCNPLEELGSEQFIARQESIINRKIDIEDKEFSSFRFKGRKHRENPPHKKSYKRSYLRFDPKRVRQLLLLRNDLSEFINHHLNNDSLRAYIELLNNEKIATSLKHGIGVYEDLFEKYVVKLEGVSQRVADQALRQQLVDGGQSMKTVFRYLTNKMHLISLANDAIKHDVFYDKSQYHKVKLKELVGGFKDALPFIFGMEQGNIRPLSMDEIFFDAESIKIEHQEIVFDMFPKLFDELIFEILYNVKRHAVLGSRSRITSSNPLEVRLFVEQIGVIRYLCISNNFLIKTTRFIRRLNEKLSRKKGVDGLNLIHNIISRTMGVKLHIEAQKGYFNVYIPIEIRNEDENTDNRR